MTDDPLLQPLLEGDRRALARAITLVESARTDHQIRAERLLSSCLRTGKQALRLGLSGTPGVGKSTFIEAFGLARVRAGQRVAVLAVDPSSARTGGSILGDKTRMPLLSREANAYIRPSPSQSTLGGVARRTRDVVLLCEAAGYDLIIIETVGVGQSETMVGQMSDLFVLLMAPAGGDELQGVKRGIMEQADLILVNKADGDLRNTAIRTCADYAGALRLMRNKPGDAEGFPRALTVSAVTGDGLETTWAAIQELIHWRKSSNYWVENRTAQNREAFRQELHYALQNKLEAAMQDDWTDLVEKSANGTITPSAAARAAVKASLGI